MTKLFFFLLIAFFIAELIIALSLIFHISKFNRTVNKWNDFISAEKTNLCRLFVDFRALMQDLTQSIICFKELVIKKKRQYVFSFLKTSAIYFGILSLKGKYKKTAIALQLAKEIYEGIRET